MHNYTPRQITYPHIPPQTGYFRRIALFNIVGSLTLGIGIATWWWYRVHVPEFKEFHDYLEEVRQETKAEYEEWLKTVEFGKRGKDVEGGGDEW